MYRLLILVLGLSLLMPGRSEAQGAAEAVRRSVQTLGIGKKAEVTLASGKRCRARIRSMDDRAFTLDIKGANAPGPLRYEDVTHVKAAGMPRAAKIALWSGAITGLLILNWFSRAISQS